MLTDDRYSTLEEHIKSRWSPRLEPAQPNYESGDTPPPLVDVPEHSEPSNSEADGEEGSHPAPGRPKSRPRPSLCDTLLIRQLGPNYPPEIAIQAGVQLLVEDPDSPCEDKRPESVNEPCQMIAVEISQDVSSTSDEASAQRALQASKTASAKLNAAMQHPLYQSKINHLSNHVNHGNRSQMIADHKTAYTIRNDVRVGDWNPGQAVATNTRNSPDRQLDVLPPPRPSLPSLRTSSASGGSISQTGVDSMTKSPTLSKYAITPSEGHPSQILAKLQSQSPPESSTVTPPDTRQTLPSLTTALNSVTDSNGTPYLDPSPALTGPSPSQYSQYGPSPSTYSQPSPMSTMSPPRLTSNPSFWRTTSQNSTVSTPSDYASAVSATSSTPASSIPGQSPVHLLHTPAMTVIELDGQNDMRTPIAGSPPTPRMDGGIQANGYTEQGYRCTWPGCNAPPFQTQYLLNSHTNVHSNTRPHFCPIKGCPRGSGGQGFKRKNEMIRHGLVHQSPGYVCPFCPEQLHKYPRPDNLQRHVRVHHTDKDRDDPLLREVLAQRPEGGNRGRRRRIGS